MNRMDQLFKSKLEGFEINPSPSAWERLASPRQHKQRLVRKPWLWAAAAVALMALLYVATDREHESYAVEPIAGKEQLPTEKLSGGDTDKSIASHEKATEIQSTRSPKDAPVPQPKHYEDSMPKGYEALPELAINVEQAAIPTKDSVQLPVRQSMKIVFSLPTLPTEHVIDETTVAAHEPHKPSGLRRALNAATEWRNGELFGNLRDAKNHLINNLGNSHKEKDQPEKQEQ